MKLKIAHKLHSCILLSIVTGASCLLPACEKATAEEKQDATPQVTAVNPAAAGRYIIMMAGCNDCHTPGFMQNPKVPESEWLTGVPLGWRGPWGTSYGANLRLSVQAYPDAESWVKAMHVREGRPPMPWSTLHSMSEKDLAAVYTYIRSLGPKGEMMPAALTPDIEPKGPYFDMTPKNLPPMPQ